MTTNDYRQLTHSLLQAAIQAAQSGWSVFPVVPSHKHPAIKDWENTATTNIEKIRAWWMARPFNIGIACGPSKLVVVDLDVAKPGQQPPQQWAGTNIRCGADVLAKISETPLDQPPLETFRVQTASGGKHLYYQAPDGVELRNTQSHIGWLIDTRAAGGYVLGPGSVVNGRQYERENACAVQPLSRCLADLLKPKPQQPSVIRRPAFVSAMSTNSRRERYLAAAVRNENHAVATTTRDRNKRLYIAALRLGELVAAGLLNTENVTAALTEAALAVGLGERETIKTIASGLKAGAKSPRRVSA